MGWGGLQDPGPQQLHLWWDIWWDRPWGEWTWTLSPAHVSSSYRQETFRWRFDLQETNRK